MDRPRRGRFVWDQLVSMTFAARSSVPSPPMSRGADVVRGTAATAPRTGRLPGARASSVGPALNARRHAVDQGALADLLTLPHLEMTSVPGAVPCLQRTSGPGGCVNTRDPGPDRHRGGGYGKPY